LVTLISSASSGKQVGGQLAGNFTGAAGTMWKRPAGAGIIHHAFFRLAFLLALKTEKRMVFLAHVGK
jgi:hypothetical protein